MLADLLEEERELDGVSAENKDKQFEDAIVLAETHVSDAKIRRIFQVIEEWYVYSQNIFNKS